MTALARNTDPVESHEAAAAVKIAHDRLLILRAFSSFRKGASYHEAAMHAAFLEGADGHHFRTESLRRRGSDLRAKGWIIQVGTRARRGVFLVTPEGLKVIRDHDERR